jgi:hypothetical protein
MFAIVGISFTLGTGFMNITILKEKAFVMRRGVISDIILRPEVAFIQKLTLILARNSIFSIEVKNIENVVEFGATCIVVNGDGLTVINRWVVWSCGTFNIYTRLQGIAFSE